MAWRLVKSQPKVGPPTPEAAIMHSNLAVRNGAGRRPTAYGERGQTSGPSPFTTGVRKNTSVSFRIVGRPRAGEDAAGHLHVIAIPI